VEKIQNLLSKDRINIPLIIIIGALLFIPFLGKVHLFDWDEANFAEAAREMVATGNYMRVTIDYQPFWEKPPLFFWLQALSMKLFGINEFAARFVNAVCGIFTLLAVYLLGRRIYDPVFGLLWALSFIGSFLPHLFFKSGIIDPLFNFFIFFGITFCIIALQKEKSRYRLAFFLLAGFVTGLGVLTKGPVAFLIVCLVVIVYWAIIRFRRLLTIADITSFLLSMVIVAFVFYGVETLYHGTWFVKEFTGYQIRLLTTGDAGHGRPFYFHFVIILFGCFPASFFAIRSFISRIETNEQQKIFNRFMIILFWVVLILFSIVETKTVLYSSLTYYPVTYLAALHMHGLIKGSLPWKKSLFYPLALFSGTVALTITFFPVLMMNIGSLLPLIKDRFAAATLQNPVPWSAFETIPGILYAAALAIGLFLLSRKKYGTGLSVFLLSTALCLQTFMIMFAPKIEQYSQGGPVAFYKSHSDGTVYVRSLFKSYTDLFYSGKPPSAHPMSYDRKWLLTGDIDKPVYFVARETQVRPSPPFDALKELKREYGFVYFIREAPRRSRAAHGDGISGN